MGASGFRPPPPARPLCAPTAVPAVEGTGFRTLQGEVEDGNSYMLGGVSGHAGLFSSVSDVERLALALLSPTDAFLNATTVRLFTAVRNATQSRRALGWDTNSSLCGDGFPPTTFTHTGYTGTQLCVDPVHGRYTVLLTNRVYPVDDAASEHRIAALRTAFNTNAASALSVFDGVHADFVPVVDAINQQFFVDGCQIHVLQSALLLQPSQHCC
eukprot:gene44550-48315_t